MTRSLLALVLVLALAGAAAGRIGAASGGQSVTLPKLEAGIVAALNEVRAAHGLRPLAPVAGLQASARSHSRTMIERGFFEHVTPDGVAFSDRIRRFYPSRGYRAWSVGENLVYQSGDLSPADAIAAWLDSPAHRRNMLSGGWRDVGVGASFATAAPGVFLGEAVSVVTVDFGTRSGKRRAFSR